MAVGSYIGMMALPELPRAIVVKAGRTFFDTSRVGKVFVEIQTSRIHFTA